MEKESRMSNVGGIYYQTDYLDPNLSVSDIFLSVSKYLKCLELKNHRLGHCLLFLEDGSLQRGQANFFKSKSIDKGDRPIPINIFIGYFSNQICCSGTLK